MEWGALALAGGTAPIFWSKKLTEIESSEDCDGELSRALAIALGRIASNPEFVVSRLISVLKDDRRRFLHRDALIALAGYGPAASPGVGACVGLLQGPECAPAAYVLARIGPNPHSREALPALRNALIASKGVRRVAIAIAIHRISPFDVAEIETTLHSVEDLHERALILGFLGRTSAEGIAWSRRWTDFLRDQIRRDERNLIAYHAGYSSYFCESLISRLAALGPSATVALPTLTGLLHHENSYIRTAAANAMRAIEGTGEAADCRDLFLMSP